MSKRKQTENLHLYAYNVPTGLPTFLKDWSDNAEILDADHVMTQGQIAELDERLTTAEGLIQDLSPESIEDYKRRLDALEHKSNAQANLIQNITAEQITQNRDIAKNANDIAELRVQVDHNTERIAELQTEINEGRADTAALEARVTSLEGRVSNCEHEIVDLTNDIIGLGENITDIAQQLEAVTNSLVNKQDKLVAGVGIRIDGNVISATGQGGGVIGQYDSTTENLTLG